MSEPHTFSVIVASRGRPESLRRTLCAVRQLDYPSFEVLVVGDPSAMRVVSDLGANGIEGIPFDKANLSVARNKGIESAAGEFCAFIDDDAVPEPLWLYHHSVALSQTGADACVGYVRGPNGIAFQSRLSTINKSGETYDSAARDEQGYVPEISNGALKLVGTNMIIRRESLVTIGGFDPSFTYYLEDSDVSLRLARADCRLAIAPLAEVHHALAPSRRRGSRRVPRTLFEIGRSSATFLRRHTGEAGPGERNKHYEQQRRRLIGFMLRGDIEPGDVERLLRGWQDGWNDGLSAPLVEMPPLSSRRRKFSPVEPLAKGTKVMTSRFMARRKTTALAEQIALVDSQRITVVSYSLTALPRYVYFSEGVWRHVGGQFWADTRRYWRFRWCRFANCVSEELARVAKQRGLDDAGEAWCGGARPTVGSVCVNVQEKGEVIS